MEPLDPPEALFRLLGIGGGGGILGAVCCIGIKKKVSVQCGKVLRDSRCFQHGCCTNNNSMESHPTSRRRA